MAALYARLRPFHHPSAARDTKLGRNAAAPALEEPEP
jgi:hypothetical protein